jgi:hypothetical protein
LLVDVVQASGHIEPTNKLGKPIFAQSHNALC